MSIDFVFGFASAAAISSVLHWHFREGVKAAIREMFEKLRIESAEFMEWRDGPHGPVDAGAQQKPR